MKFKNVHIEFENRHNPLVKQSITIKDGKVELYNCTYEDLYVLYMNNKITDILRDCLGVKKGFKFQSALDIIRNFGYDKLNELMQEKNPVKAYRAFKIEVIDS